MNRRKYYDSLLKWLAPALSHTFKDQKSGFMCYGPGYNGWGVQTTQKAFAAFATAATDDRFDERIAKMSREEALGCAVSMFRYNISTHLEGDFLLADGEKWGHTWISGLGIERMMHGTDVIWEYLAEEDKELFQRVLLSEADWLMDHWEVEAEPFNIVEKTDFVGSYGLRNAKNRPESNVWNGAILFRAAMIEPDAEKIKRYTDKATRFFVNAVSVPEDEKSLTVYNGKTVGEMFVGANFLKSYALDHHGYLNTGYMAITLSNMAMIHYAFSTWDVEPPPAIYHHAAELWQIIKTFTFPDGRQLQLGGDSRARYCYCQDYMTPCLIYARDVLGDEDAEKMETAWAETVFAEQDSNGDGSYLGERCGALSKVSPLYFTRLESDRAATVAMGYLWGGLLLKNKSWDYKNTFKIPKSWNEPYHGACIVRSKRRAASWVWRASEGATGLCLPPEKSSMAEWRHNMLAEILPQSQSDRIIAEGAHREKTVPGGFLTFGQAKHIGRRFIAENENDRIVAVQEAAVCALPDDSTMVVMQRAVSCARNYFRLCKGMFVQIPNDIFNGRTRRMVWEGGDRTLTSLSGGGELTGLSSKWVNIDGCLGLIACYGAGEIELWRDSKRQIGMSGRYIGDEMLYCEEFCMASRLSPFYAEKDEAIVDVGFAVKAGVDPQRTKEASRASFPTVISETGRLIRAVAVPGENGKDYLFVANFDNEPDNFKIDCRRFELKAETGGGDLEYTGGFWRIKPKSAALFAAP